MKTIITIVFLFTITISEITYSQWQATFLNDILPNHIQFISSSTGYMFGRPGRINRTTDGGESWQRMRSDFHGNFRNGFFISVYTGWVSEGDRLLKTINGGGTFISYIYLNSPVNSIFFTSETEGWITGVEGRILKSTDGGDNWIRKTSDSLTNNISAIQFTSQSTGWAAGQSGLIMKTTDGGESWITQITGTSADLQSLSFVTPQFGCAVGNTGTILLTSNGGINWSIQITGGNHNSVSFYDQLNGCIVGINEPILRTSNGGTSWVEDPIGLDFNLIGVSFFSNTKCIAIGYMDEIQPYILKYYTPVQLSPEINLPPPNVFTSSLFGTSANSAGDVNGDGYDDVIIGYPNFLYSSGSVGAAFIYFGGQNMDISEDISLLGEFPIYRNFGYSSCGAGDVNRDGFDDVIVGAYGNENFHGMAYIFYGGENMGNANVIMEGEQLNNSFGFSVSPAGDINGDGYDDVIVGSKGYNGGTGRAYVYFGGISMDNVADIIMTGEFAGDYFGKSVSTAGDVNGDGYNDVIVGAYCYLNNTGRAYVYFGGRNMDNSADIIMTGETDGFDIKFGSYASTAGDVNNDGYSDLIIGAGDEINCTNRAYVFYGGAEMDNVPDLTLSADMYCENFAPVFINEDFNGDSYSDVIVGAPGFDRNRGKTYIFTGGSTMNNSADYFMTGIDTASSFGYWVSSAGDVNSDGYSDLIVGAPDFGPGDVSWGMAHIKLGFGDPDKTLSGLIIEPEYSIQQINTQVCLTGTVKNKLDQPMNNIRINYFIRGANDGYGNGFSNGNGIVQYCYIGLNPGIDTIIAVSGKFRDTTVVFWESQTACIAGAEYITRNSVNLFFTESLTDVYWDISNFESTEAEIISGNQNDSVYVDAGNNLGHFVLYLVTPDSTFCIKHVFVDNPAPVELSSFTSSINGRNITLNWTTVYEINNSGFEIERQSSGKVLTELWRKVGFIKGNGTTSLLHSYEFTDKEMKSGKYNYRLKQIDYNGNYEYLNLEGEVNIGIPEKYDMSQNYPNPFNPKTIINFQCSMFNFVSLIVYDINGKEITKLVNENMQEGYYSVVFDGSNLPSGVYFYKMTAGEFTAVRKFVIVK